MTRRNLFASLIGAPVAAASIPAEPASDDADELLTYGLRKGQLSCILRPSRIHKEEEGIILFDCPLPGWMADSLYLDEGDGFSLLEVRGRWRPVNLGARAMRSSGGEASISLNIFYE